MGLFGNHVGSDDWDLKLIDYKVVRRYATSNIM